MEQAYLIRRALEMESAAQAATRMTEGMDPAPLSTTPDVVAECITDGLAKGAAVVWAPAPLRFVMSGLRHLPRPVWRKASERG